ncbi:MAG: 3-dehydroquinate synthase [Luteibacter sp.]|uniref:3-dehydroquinate synthase n=1 Tax=unclassified Luteibacter TaxID=2620188 RepID=UPI002807F0EA|nr:MULTISPECIES: 3-dehydroquinate synthase [unclassified Luteibacter]MDQ7997174.1 3-dehydroquinate synthase [Luteibacter sp.]MDQ8049912.1 3-dehydroquinate synthase [Luteibacter sp.]MDR6644551.1 3-dehydroquinate synthase [Luteibacter sp. 1214]
MDIATVDVDLAGRSYPVWIGPGLLADNARWRTAIRGRHVLVVSNTTVAPLYLDALAQGLDGLRWSSYLLEDGETHKTFANVGKVLEALGELGATRDACVIALGGGVVGDLAGFAAACWMRGIDFVQIPTTLLAMVDSSVGGKTGVNLPAGKNLAGAFHQPRAVVADTYVLDTLPQREFRAGLAEIVKGAAIGDPDFFAWLEDHADALSGRETGPLIEAIARKCRYKAGVVARDETEQGERALLNLGHTFGHALETAGNYSEILHGEGVAIGMVLAAKLSERLGMAPATDTQRLVTLLRRLDLPTEPSGKHAASRLLELMRLDKKNTAGTLRLILWRGIGRAEIVAGVAEDDVLGVLI